MRTRSVIAAFAVSCLLASGCGQSDNRVPIKGSLFCDDKPLAGASVAFIGDGGGAFGSTVSDSEGNFTIRAAIGKNKVTVAKASSEPIPATDPNADQSMPTDAEYTLQIKRLPKPIVAERFSDPNRSGIFVDVIGGMQPFDIRVTSK
jgi:hypothetical protein